MKKIKKKIKKNWKKILLGVVIGAVTLGLVGGIAGALRNDTKTISATAFSRGGLDEQGNYLSTDQSIYTKEMFGCIGLRVVPDFECDSTFDVYYYDYNGNYIDSQLGLSKIYDEDFPLAQTARIVIHPEIPEDVDTEDFEIGFFEVYDLANDFTITVDKNQENKYSGSVNLYNDASATFNKTFQNLTDLRPSAFDSKNLVDLSTDLNAMKVSGKINVDNAADYYDVFVYLDVDEVRWPIAAIFDAEGKCISDDGDYFYDTIDTSTVTKPCWVKLTVAVPELESYEGVHLMVTLPDDSNCYIFGYND